jgi:hypothetical protein
VSIRLSVPHAAMPLTSVENPCCLDGKPTGSDFRCIMKDVWYRKITKSVFPPRNLGAAEISLTHISSLRVIRERQSSDCSILVFISSADFLDTFHHPMEGERRIDTLAFFHCPKLGRVKLQRYWVTARAGASRSFLLKFGYRLEISPDVGCFTSDELLARVLPILNILSIFFRQRILVHGWYISCGGVEESSWKDPLQPGSTPYVGVAPEQYLSSWGNLSDQVDCAINGYYGLGEDERKAVFALSYCLSPAIKLQDGERFMALFRQFESMGRKASVRQPLTEDENDLLKKLSEIADSYLANNRAAVYDRINGFARKVSGGSAPLSEDLADLLRRKGVRSADLWRVAGANSLMKIRDKLAHGGSHRIHHQGLAVATFHLSLLAERLVFALLRLSLEKSIDNQIARDEWLQPAYVRSLQESIFNV